MFGHTMFRNSFAALKLLNPALDLRFVGFAAFLQPTVLLLRCLQKMKQHFFDASRTSELELFLESRSDFIVTDFDIHDNYP